eukprot:6020439-Pyramimonas_sp.AAC.2
MPWCNGGNEYREYREYREYKGGGWIPTRQGGSDSQSRGLDLSDLPGTEENDPSGRAGRVVCESHAEQLGSL